MIIDWIEPIEVETGDIEVTDLTDIDRAVARVIGGAIDSMVVTDKKRRENTEFDRFTAKSIKEKLYIGQFDDPASFLSTLAKNSKQDSLQERKNMLPVFYLYREPGFSFTDGSDYVDLTNCAELLDQNGQRYANINKSFLKLSYTLTALAWEKATVTRMGLGMTMRMRHARNGRKYAFKAKTMIAGSSVDLHCEIDLLRDTMATSITPSFVENRINGLVIQIEVVAEVMEAIGVTIKPRRLELYEAEVMR